jgi:hypothetical protein
VQLIGFLPPQFAIETNCSERAVRQRGLAVFGPARFDASLCVKKRQ